MSLPISPKPHFRSRHRVVPTGRVFNDGIDDFTFGADDPRPMPIQIRSLTQDALLMPIAGEAKFGDRQPKKTIKNCQTVNVFLNAADTQDMARNPGRNAGMCSLEPKTVSENINLRSKA